MHILSPPGETHEFFAFFAEPRPDAFPFGPKPFKPGVRFGVPLHPVTLGAGSSDFHQRRDHTPFDVLCQRKSNLVKLVGRKQQHRPYARVHRRRADEGDRPIEVRHPSETAVKLALRGERKRVVVSPRGEYLAPGPFAHPSGDVERGCESWGLERMEKPTSTNPT